MSKTQLGVIFGSRTCEHEVSIISAVQMMKAVNRQLYDVIPIYITKRGVWYTGDPLFDLQSYTPAFDEQRKDVFRVALDVTPGSGALITTEAPKGLFGKEKQRVVARLDCVIPVMHGMHGEDGTLQGMLELAGIPYASSGVAASAIGMDKVIMKQFFIGGGYPVVPGLWCTRAHYEKHADEFEQSIENDLGYPVFVKPAMLGSSIGVCKAKNREELRQALSEGFEYDRKVLVEKGIENPLELNCSVLGFDDDVQASEIEMPISSGGDLLDFMAKYGSGGNSTKGMASLKRILPAKIEPELKEKIQSLSIDIFKHMDCKGVVRIDYMYDAKDGQLYITEINTIPGSMAFYLWQCSAMPYEKLVDKLVELAMRAQREKEDSNFAFSSDILKNLSAGKAGSKMGLKNA